MISAVNFNAIDAMLRAAKEVDLPMGGIHVVGTSFCELKNKC